MTGIYKIWLPLDSPDGRHWPVPTDYFDRQWHLFVGTCRKLAAAQASYSVGWQLGAPQPHAVIRATIPVPKPTQAPKPSSRTLPELLTPQTCDERATAAQRSLLGLQAGFARQLAEWRRDSSTGYCRWAYHWDAERQARCRALGRALRVIHARRPFMGDLAYRLPSREDYQTLDAALCQRVPRLSKLIKREAERGYYATLIKLYTGGTLGKRPSEPDAPDPIAQERWYRLAMTPKPLLRQIAEARAEVEFWEECGRLARERLEGPGEGGF